MLRGGVDIDDDEEIPTDGLPTVRGYQWASHDVVLYVSKYVTKARLKWRVDRSFIVTDEEDTRLIRLSVSGATNGFSREKSPVWTNSFSCIPICSINCHFGCLSQRFSHSFFERLGLSTGVPSHVLCPRDNSFSPRFCSLFQSLPFC